MKVLEKAPKQRTEVRQASLVDAALLLAAQRSPADITTADLAQTVGITQGAVFRHFASKEAIWLAVLDWVSDALMARLQSAADAVAEAAPSKSHGAVTPAAPTAMAGLRAVFLAHVDFVLAYPGVPRLIFQELQSPDDTALKKRVRMLMQRYRQLLVQLLRQAQNEQKLHPAVDPQAAAILFIGSVQGLVMQAMISNDVQAMVAQAPGVFAIVQRGLENLPTVLQGKP
ncbi:TetR/AcrR family transcriptional regulator [Rhodoferax sp.]|uniref:TetR/AcrR family transcriptional regulator n=1 Tax=Rhodoferax sp. TaxID=50421 RepID=UPI00260C18A9|nr:TetR/AcrR family transcriptional regulator [Rhodoferax sp.]MDD2919154.1 TetR/AcrR family transcriptional regulator [Rhodoferax sp.]